MMRAAVERAAAERAAAERAAASGAGVVLIDEFTSTEREFVVVLRRNVNGLGVVFDQDTLQVTRLVEGCAAAEHGALKIGDMLLSVRREGVQNPVYVRPGDSLTGLFPPGKMAFEIRLSRPPQRSARGPGVASLEPGRVAKELKKGLLHPPPAPMNTIATTSQLRLPGLGPHAFVNVPIDRPSATVQLPSGLKSSVAIQSPNFHIDNVPWLPTGVVDNLSDGMLPPSGRKWQPSNLAVSRVGLSCAPPCRAAPPAPPPPSRAARPELPLRPTPRIALGGCTGHTAASTAQAAAARRRVNLVPLYRGRVPLDAPRS